MAVEKNLSCVSRWLVSLLAATTAALSLSCDADAGSVGSTTERAEGAPALRVVVTTGMIADIVANVGAPHVAVDALMSEGTDPHFYRPSPGDIIKLAAKTTDIIFYNGLHLEGKMAAVLVDLGKRKRVVAVTDDIDRSRLRAPPEFQNQYDPHVWFDVSLWIECVNSVRDVLIEGDSQHAVDYRQQAARYVDKLTKLHQQVKIDVGTIPESQRVLITAHDAFGYFGRAYGIKVLGVQGVSTDSEAGVRRIEELVDLIVTRKIKAVFVESSVSERNIRALVEGCAARGHAVNIGGQLFSDAMGKKGSLEGTYEGMVRHNVETIVNALR